MISQGESCETCGHSEQVLEAPRAIEAEAAVISAMLADPTAIDEVLATLRPDHFWSESNRWICEAAFDLSARGVKVDSVTVANWLRDTGRLAQVGGSAYLIGVLDKAPFVSNVSSYARIVVQKATMRRLIATCQKIAAEGYEELGDPDRFVAKAAEALDLIARESAGPSIGQDTFSERELFTAVAQEMIDGKPPQACTIGIGDMDQDIGGHVAGHVSWMGAATNWGKSSFAVMNYDEAVTAGARVLVVSCEDKRQLFARRILARRAGVSAYALRENRLNKEDFAAITGVAQSAATVPFFVQAIGKTAETVAARITHICRAEKIDLVIVDYLQAIQAGRRTQDKRNEMTYVARTLTDAIKGTESAAGLIFSQIKRLEDGKIPGMHDLKESGDIENMAENVFIGYVGKDGDSILRVAKAKDAVKRDYLMQWNARSCSFVGGSRIEGRSAA